MHYSLVPSLPADSWKQLEAVLTAVTGVAQEFQVDLVDGVFVPARSWPFVDDDPHRALQQLAPFTDRFDIEFDCMVTEPAQYLDTLLSLNTKRIIVHHGSFSNWQQLLAHKQKHGYQLGLAFTNDVPLEDVVGHIAECDFVQVMGIATVGAQGQPFDERTLETVATLRASHPELEIAIDGAVNESTIPLLKQAGANRFAPGSAISRAADPVAAYKHLFALMQSS